MLIKRITDYLEKTVQLHKDDIAIIDELHKLTFGQLRQKALNIAGVLINNEIFKKPVVVLMDKNCDMVVSFLGIAYSGNYYTPIDINMPEERVEKILKTLNPAYVIIGSGAEKMAETLGLGNYETALYYDIVLENPNTEEKILPVTKRIIDTDILYVLFTSGSTGNPKGVIISHRSVIDYIEWVTDTFNITSDDRFANQAPFYFDNSILDIYCMLKAGCTMYIVPEKLFTFPIGLMKYLEDNKITSIFWVPSALCLVANLKALGKQKLSNMKRILFCGEPMPNKQLNMWRQEYPDVQYANLYGPTEITDVCSYYIVDREFADSDPLPIGFPCENTDIIVLNDKDELVKHGETGELCVRGSSLAYGYYNDEKRTKEAFVQNPLNKNYKEIIYRTGDLVYYNEYNELVYVSRKDFQIKHMGHRIELGEIENAVYAVQGITRCCCLYNSECNKIVLFYTGQADIKIIKKILKKKIPEYMVPSDIRLLEQMPLNLNGKIDRVKLKEIL